MVFIDPATVILKDGQFSINDVRFGKWTNAPVELVDWGGFDISANFTENAYTDGAIFGSEFARGSTVVFTGGFINNIRDAQRSLASAWSDNKTRRSAGKVTQLFYQRDGETRFLVGRPRRFYTSLLRTKASFATFDSEFQRSSPLSFGRIMNYDVVSNTDPIVLDNSTLMLGDAPMPIRINYEPGLETTRFIIRRNDEIVVDFNLQKISQSLEVASSFPGELFVTNGANESIRGFLNPLTTKLGDLYLDYDDMNVYSLQIVSNNTGARVPVNVEILSASWGL